MSENGIKGLAAFTMHKQAQHQKMVKSVEKAKVAIADDAKSPEQCTRVVTYFSKSHNKQRYFIGFPVDQDDGDGKIKFSYIASEGTKVSRNTGKKVIKALNRIGYTELSMVLDKPH